MPTGTTNRGHQTGPEAVTPGLTIFLEVPADGTGGAHKTKPFMEEFKVARKQKQKTKKWVPVQGEPAGRGWPRLQERCEAIRRPQVISGDPQGLAFIGQTLGRCVRPAFLVSLVEQLILSPTAPCRAPFLALKKVYLFLCVCVYPSVYVCVSTIGGQKRVSGPPGAGVIGSCGCWDLNLEPLKNGSTALYILLAPLSLQPCAEGAWGALLQRRSL